MICNYMFFTIFTIKIQYLKFKISNQMLAFKQILMEFKQTRGQSLTVAELKFLCSKENIYFVKLQVYFYWKLIHHLNMQSSIAYTQVMIQPKMAATSAFTLNLTL